HFCPEPETTIGAIVDTAVFKCMKTVSHRGHREHRELIMSSVPSVRSVAIHPYENQYNFPGRRLRDVGIKVMSFVVVERVEARGQASWFMAGQTGDAGVGGGLRILFPFFSDRAVRGVGEHGEYLVEMPHRLFVAASA